MWVSSTLLNFFRWFVVILVCAKVQKIFAFPDFEQPDFSRLNRNATHCSSTKLAFQKESLLHTWSLHGILNYMMYLKRFNQSFEIKTEEITFKSEHIDGKWIFKFSKLKPILRTKTLLTATTATVMGSTPATPPAEEESTDFSSSPMKISAIYSYDAKEQKRLNFGIFLTIIQENRELVLPLQTSADPIVSQQRTYDKARANSVQIFTFSHSFTWPDVHEEFDTMVANSEGKDDLSLRFLITVYYPQDPSFSPNGENCNEGLLYEIAAKKLLNNAVPPYLLHSHSMLHDDKYTDLFLRVGNEDFPAHRIILATTSPVFSSLIYNETFVYGQDNIVKVHNGSLPPTVIHIDDDIESETVVEMLRYIYTGRVNNLSELADQLILAADRYSLPQLKKICEMIILSQIKNENAIDNYILGMQVNSNRLTKKAFAVMRANKGKISSLAFKTLSIQYPNLMFELFVS